MMLDYFRDRYSKIFLRCLVIINVVQFIAIMHPLLINEEFYAPYFVIFAESLLFFFAIGMNFLLLTVFYFKRIPFLRFPLINLLAFVITLFLLSLDFSSNRFLTLLPYNFPSYIYASVIFILIILATVQLKSLNNS